MGYLGLTPTTAQQNYLNIDDISGSFNGSTTSFALQVGSVAPTPFPVTNSCLISVGGVIQEPDDTGTSGFRISGGNIVFSSAPGTGEDFFGLILAGADYLNIGANFPDGTVGTPSITFDSDTNTGIYHPSADELSFVTGGSDRVRVDSNGRLGIGTSSPNTGSKLHVVGDILITGTNARFNAGIDGSASNPTFVVNDGDTGMYRAGANALGFTTGGTAALTIDSSQRVGIGTASPATPLTLDGGDLKLTTATSTTRRVFALGGTGNYSLGTSGGAAIAFIRDGSNNDSIAFETHVQGSSHAERVRILSGGGITFNGDTAAANALDDYEEGTWTPSISASSGTITTSSGSGRYVKIGRLVTVHFIITISNVGTANGAYLNFGNLPFTSSNTHNQPGVCREQSINGFLSAAQVTGNATTGQILRYDNSGVVVNGGNYQCTITYEAQ